jgi:hypothetical protein
MPKIKVKCSKNVTTLIWQPGNQLSVAEKGRRNRREKLYPYDHVLIMTQRFMTSTKNKTESSGGRIKKREKKKRNFSVFFFLVHSGEMCFVCGL